MDDTVTATVAQATASKLAPSAAIMSRVDEAVRRFNLIQPGDRVALAFSGGKDSLLMIAALRALQRRKDYDFTLQVIHLDQQQPGFNLNGFQQNLANIGEECTIITRDTWSIVEQQRKPGQIPCAVCSRLRRGILNQWCAQHGFNKLAIGHHLDDAIETFLLNLLFGRRLEPLKPLTPASEHDVTAIRPCLFVEENKIRSWLLQTGLTPVACPVCDSFPDAKRRDLKKLIQGLTDTQPEIYASIRDALYSVS